MLSLIGTSYGLAQTEAESALVLNPNFDPSNLSDEELLDLLGQIEERRELPRRTAIFGIPSGYGAPRGLVFFSAAATNRRDRGQSGDWDASLALGFGMGDAQRGIGFTPVLEITSVSPYHFGSSGKVGLHVSRQFTLGDKWHGATALGLHNLLTWGDSSVLDQEYSLAFSSVRPADDALGVPILISAGYGSGISRFGAEPGYFGGIGVGLRDDFGLSLGWYGDEAIAGANFWLGPQRNLLISLGIGDIMNSVSGRRLLLNATIAKRFWGQR